MIKSLLKNLIATIILATSFTVNAQSFNENFQSWATKGYTNDPGSTRTSCETSGNFVGVGVVGTPVTIGPITYSGGPTVTYSLVEGGVAPLCPFKSTGTGCPKPQTADTTGYVQIAKSATSSFTTSTLTNVTTIEIIYSSTGSSRSGRIQKSIDGGLNWTNVRDTIGNPIKLGTSNCSASGYDSASIVINEPTVQLRFTCNPAWLQIFRIHKLKVNSTPLGLQNSMWSESGISTSLDNNTLTVISKNVAGSVDVVSLIGTIVGQKEIQNGGQTFFAMPTSGLYLIRFTSSDNKIYSKKIVVN